MRNRTSHRLGDEDLSARTAPPELELDVVRVTEYQRRTCRGIRNWGVFDGEAGQAGLPRVEFVAVDNSKSDVVKSEISLIEPVGSGDAVLVQSDDQPNRLAQQNDHDAIVVIDASYPAQT